LFLSKWPIRNKLVIGLLLLLVIVGTLTYSGIQGLYAYRNLVKSLEQRLPELPRATELMRRVSDLRVAVSNLRTDATLRAHTGEEPAPPLDIWIDRETFRATLGDVERALFEYSRQLEKTADHKNRIGDSHREWDTVRSMQDSLTAIRAADGDVDWAMDQVRFGALEEELERMQVLSGDLPEFLHDDIEAFITEIRGQYRALIVLAWLASGTTGLLLLLFVRLSYKWVFRPLRMLVKGSRKVAAGQFDHRITVDTADEMHELAEALNDMTARFRHIRDDLDRQVRERTKQVVRSEQLASVGFLAAGVAHEINNPLASIALCAESLEGRVTELLEDDDPRHSVIRNYLRMIQEEAFRCKGITERLLDFSRIGEARRQTVDLRDLVQTVIEMAGHLGKYREKHVHLLPGESVYASVHAAEIKQVVLNLLTNGLDSLDPEGTVTVSVEERDGQAELALTDDGCGMAPDVLEHLFEPFFTRRRNGQGTGLGLSISYRIVADHGGQIAAASDGPGRGATFRVTLPLAAQAKEERHRYQAA